MLASWHKRLYLGTSISFAVALPAMFLVMNYFEKTIFSDLTFSPRDGWCNAPLEGVGVHCFGDYAFPRVLLREESIWSNSYGIPHPYTPSAMLPHWIAAKVEQLIGSPRVVLVLYIAALSLAVLFPSLWTSVRTRKEIPRATIPLFFGTISFPFIAIVDRGNSVGFAIPAVFFFFSGLNSRKEWISPLALIVAASIRPQFALLGLALILVNRWRAVAVSALGSALVFFVGFAVWPGNFTSNLSMWWQSTTGFDKTLSLDSDRPANLAGARAVVKIAGYLDSAPVGIGSFAQGIRGFVMAHPSAPGLIGVAVTTLVVIVFRTRIPVWFGCVLILPLPFLATSLAYPYYSGLILVLTTWFFLDHVGDGSTSEATETVSVSVRWLWCLIVALVTSIVPFPLVLQENHYAFTVDNLGTVWLVIWGWGILAILVQCLNRPSRSDKRQHGDPVSTM
jgi:hypothetical protein